MKNPALSTLAPSFSPTPMFNGVMLTGWTPDWMGGIAPLCKLQTIMAKALSEIIEGETEFMLTCAAANMKMAECIMQSPGPSPASLASCYHEILGEVADASLERMNKVSDMTAEFRQQIWEEL